MVISTFGSANPQAALAFTTYYAGSQNTRFRLLLSQMLSSPIFYNPWLKQFYSIPNQNIEEEIFKSKKVILQINHWASLEEFLDALKKVCSVEDLEYKKVFVNGNKESVYEMKVK